MGSATNSRTTKSIDNDRSAPKNFAHTKNGRNNHFATFTKVQSKSLILCAVFITDLDKLNLVMAVYD